MKFKSVEDILNERLEKATPYMMRNDGAVFKCGGYHPYISNVYSSDDDLNSLINERIDELEWFYSHTLLADAIKDIQIIVKSLCHFNENYLYSETVLFSKFNVDSSTYCCYNRAEIIDFMNELNYLVNQEFCRIRTSDVKYGGNSNDVYFRISSQGFNWFNLMWKFVNDNDDFISTVTVSKDGRARDFSLGDCYKVNGTVLDHIPADEFLTLKGNPVIEQYKSSLTAINEANAQLRLGKSVKDAYPNLHPRDVVGFYKKQISEQYSWDLENILQPAIRGAVMKFKLVESISIDEQTFKDAFSEPMNTLYGSKDMGMDVVCERLYYDYGIDATYHGATIYVGDKKLCTLRFSHEGRNLWGIYEIRTYIDGLKKVYTVHDFFE